MSDECRMLYKNSTEFYGEWLRAKTRCCQISVGCSIRVLRSSAESGLEPRAMEGLAVMSRHGDVRRVLDTL